MEDAITCERFVELVTDYLEGVLDADDARRFEEHLVLCPGCEIYLEQIRETATLVGRLEEQHLTEPARSQLLEAFRGWGLKSG